MSAPLFDRLDPFPRGSLVNVDPSLLRLLIGALGVCSLVVALRFAGQMLREKMAITETHRLDIDLLGKERPKSAKLEGTAVIIGGSIGGLLAARACHDHFERVVIVEAESWLTEPEASSFESWNQTEKRTRIMQYRSLQGLFPVNRVALNRLFTDLEQECVASSIRLPVSETNNFMGGRHIPAPRADYAASGDMPCTLGASRRAYETLLRRLTLGKGHYPNIEYVTGTVVGLTPHVLDHTRIQSVQVRTNKGSTAEINSALVVDSSGQGRTSLKWLDRAGYGAGPDKRGQLPFDQLETTFSPKVHYATFELSLPESLWQRLPVPDKSYIGDACFIFSCLPSWDRECRSLYACRIEDGRIHLCAGMWGEEYTLPRNIDQIKAWAQDLVTDAPLPTWIFDVIEALTEVEDTMTVDFANAAPSSHIRFHLAGNLPSNYTALGDAVMRINPVYAHGCSKALYGVLALNTALYNAQDLPTLPENFSKIFFKSQHAKIQPMWDLTKVVDYAFPSTIPEGNEKLSQGAGLRWYLKKLQHLASVDPKVGSEMWHVNMMLAPSIDLVAPRLLAKVLWHALWNSKSA